MTAKDKEYVVEQIHDHSRKFFFHVKWKNYPIEDNTWEPLENIIDCSQLQTYLRTLDKFSREQVEDEILEIRIKQEKKAQKEKEAKGKNKKRARSTSPRGSSTSRSPSPKKKKKNTSTSPKKTKSTTKTAKKKNKSPVSSYRKHRPRRTSATY